MLRYIKCFHAFPAGQNDQIVKKEKRKTQFTLLENNITLLFLLKDFTNIIPWRILNINNDNIFFFVKLFEIHGRQGLFSLLVVCLYAKFNHPVSICF